MSYSSGGGGGAQPKLPRNIHHHLEGNLWLHYLFLPHTFEEGIAAGINKFLSL